MIIEHVTDLGKDALENPKKYNAFIGISIPHKFFSKENIKTYSGWCSKQFKEFIILLMDDPEKYNFQVFKNMDEKETLGLVRKKSDELKRGYEKVLQHLSISNIKILQFRDFCSNNQYKNILQEIKTQFDSNEKFRNDLFSLMLLNIGGKIKELPYGQKGIENIKMILVNYIIEELASILYLTVNGYPIELSPNFEFETKRRIYEGDFPELYQKLRLTKRGHLFIHPRNVSKSNYKPKS